MQKLWRIFGIPSVLRLPGKRCELTQRMSGSFGLVAVENNFEAQPQWRNFVKTERVLLIAAACVLLCSGRTSLADYFGPTSIEPRLGGRTDIILYEDFENSEWWKAGHWSDRHEKRMVQAPLNTSLSSTAFRGNRSLRVFSPKGSHDGTRFDFFLNDLVKPVPEELYFRYYVRFGDTWKSLKGGGKMPGFMSVPEIKAGEASDGTNGWSMSGSYTPPPSGYNSDTQTRMAWYSYHADMTGDYGKTVYWSNGNKYLTRGRWHCVEGYVKVNSVGSKNGVTRGWIDGSLVEETTDWRMRTVSGWPIADFRFIVYHGGANVAPQNMDVFFDNLVLAKSRVGCDASTGLPEPSGLPAPEILILD